MKKGSISIGCFVIIIIMIIAAVIMACLTSWTQGNLEWLFGYIMDKTVHIPYWLVFILNIICNFFAFVFNIICEILKCVL